jgi:hypothetical protein
MFVKRFKRKCDVRGCKNITDVFLISQRREMGNTVGICRECMKQALEATADYTEPIKVQKPIRPLFPHPEIRVTPPSVADELPNSDEVINAVAEDANISVTEDAVTSEDISTEPIPTPTPIPTLKPKNTANKKKAKKK